MFGASPQGDNPLEALALGAVMVPVALLTEVHKALKDAGHELAGKVLELIPAPGAHGDE